MKRTIYLILSLLMCGAFANAQGAKPQDSVRAVTNVRGVKYPVILPDHRVYFRIKAPNAQKMQIDLGKKYDMVKDAQGNWTATTDSLGEGFHYYSLIIDGISVADPASESFYGMSRMASGIEIPFAGGDFYAMKDVPHGDIRIKMYYSGVTKSWRRLYVYTPPGYDANTTIKYPVLYILHGGGEDERGWATQGKADLILDNLIAQKQAKPMLIVMPDANMPNANGMGEDGLKAFANEMKLAIIPFVEKTYRVDAQQKSRAMAGLSMGGINTLYTGLYNTDIFSYIGIFSSGWIAPAQNALANAQYDYLAKNAAKVNANLRSLFITTGEKEDLAFKNSQIMLAKLDELKIKHTNYDYRGGHTWPVWRHNLYKFAQVLFK